MHRYLYLFIIKYWVIFGNYSFIMHAFQIDYLPHMMFRLEGFHIHEDFETRTLISPARAS